MGADVTEFKRTWGKAYFAPVYDFASKEIVRLVHVLASEHGPAVRADRPAPCEDARRTSTPILHSDMGWQYQQPGWCGRLEKAGVVQSMSRKGNCIDNGATEQVFGHMKDEFFKGQSSDELRESSNAVPGRLRHPLEHEEKATRTEGTDPERSSGISPLRLNPY